MDFIEDILGKLTDWARKILDALLGPEAQPEQELIPVPVDDRYR